MNQPVRVLYAACERVPGPTAAGTRLSQVILGFSGQLDADGLSLKSDELAHIQRLGTARMMRVPQHDGGFVARISAFQRALKRQLEGDSYELCHASDAWAAAVATQHKEQAPDLKVITELTELPTQTLAERHPNTTLEDKVRQIMRRGETMVLQRSDALVVDSHAAKAMLVQLGAKEERIHVVPPGVDESVFFASTVELRMRDGQLNLLFAGSPEPARGLTTFLQALQRMPRNVTGMLCRIRAREPAAEEAVAALGLQDRVTWQDVPTAQKLAQAFQLADVVVLLPFAPANAVHGGHIPRRLLEAMACRRVVVCTDLVGVREVLQDQTNGILLPHGDPGALEDVLMALGTDPALRGRLASRAHETAGQFGWAERLTVYRRLYSRLLGQNFEVEEKRQGRAGGLAERLKQQRASKAPGAGFWREEKAGSPHPTTAPPPASPFAPLYTTPSLTAEPLPPAVMGRPLPAGPPTVVGQPIDPAPPFEAPMSSAFISTLPGPLGSPSSPPFDAPVSGAFGALATAPSAAPAFMPLHPGTQAPPTLVPLVTGALAPPAAPELPLAALLPKAWPFGEPVTGPENVYRAVVTLAVPTLPPVVHAPDGVRRHFLMEPTPNPPGHREPTPSPETDPWGGDTLAVNQPSLELDGPPVAAQPYGEHPGALPPLDPARPSLPGTTGRALRGPPGMRSLALLDAMTQDMGLGLTPLPSPGGATETERLEMTPSQMGTLYGRSPPMQPLTAQVAGQVRFGSEQGSESPTVQHQQPNAHPTAGEPMPAGANHDSTPQPDLPTDEPTTT